MNPKKLLLCGLAASPVLLLAFSAGPPIMRTGALVDGGLDCTACHRGQANDGRGRLTITASNYTPGVKQIIRVRLEHPEAMRWGFQLTARLRSDQTKQAGTFTAGGEIRVACAPSGLAPCNGNLEFASQNATSTSPGTRQGRTWEVEWTPPETNVGEVIFYAAGNAASGANDGNQGDFIYTTSASITATTPGAPRPAITRGGVADAFNFQSNIASNTWLAIVGTNLAPTTQTWDSSIRGQTLPTSLEGVSVRINNRPATIFFVSPTQVNALAPLDDSTGDVSVVVTTPAGDSEPIVVRKQSAAPALYAPFAQNNRLFVTAVALDGTLVGKPGVDSRVTRAARPGETIQLFGTGFGATNPAVPTDRVVSGTPELTRKPVIRIADTMVNFPGNGNLIAAGIFQFNITIPATLADGDHAIVAEVDGIRSANTVFITVAR